LRDKDFEEGPQREQKTAERTELEGPCTDGGKAPQYYFNDIWIYESSINQWMERQIYSTLPQERRGHKVVARWSRTNDTQLIMIGGHNQDSAFADMWILNLMREDPKERVWTRIDPYFTGQRPPSMSHHSMLYSEALNSIILFGGAHWKTTDLEVSDQLRNIDRRCLKEAQGLPDRYSGMQELVFLKKMRKNCLAENMKFCCAMSQHAADGEPFEAPGEYIDEMRIRTDEGLLNLTALSSYCRVDCSAKAFFPEFYPILVEGVYTFKIDECENDCSFHGFCDLSQCVCEPEWYGVDCSQRRCPGSTCYTHPRTKEQFCVDCSQHGRCIDGQCDCFTGWSMKDCSAPLCEDNCSSTPTATRGICVEDFPINQCTCLGRWSGDICSELLCLNSCSGRGKCVDGTCVCDEMYYGDDCSLFVFDPSVDP